MLPNLELFFQIIHFEPNHYTDDAIYYFKKHHIFVSIILFINPEQILKFDNEGFVKLPLELIKAIIHYIDEIKRNQNAIIKMI
jgi:hypothetical protein